MFLFSLFLLHSSHGQLLGFTACSCHILDFHLSLFLNYFINETKNLQKGPWFPCIKRRQIILNTLKPKSLGTCSHIINSLPGVRNHVINKFIQRKQDKNYDSTHIGYKCKRCHERVALSAEHVSVSNQQHGCDSKISA